MRFDQPHGSTPIDPDEAAALKPSLSTQAELDEFESQNISRSILWAERSRIVRSSLLQTPTLRLVHQKMFGDTWKWAGQIRKTQKNIGIDAWRILQELKMLEDDAGVWLEFGTYDGKESATRIHHRLVWIHPFPNGNGRLARLIADLFCDQRGIRRSTWGQSAEPLHQIRQKYIESLRAADQGEIAPLYEFMWP